MGTKRTLNDLQRREVAIALGQGKSRSVLAAKYNVAYNTIKRIEVDAKNGNDVANVYKESAKIAKESEKRLLDILESNTPFKIVSKIITILDDEDLLKKEIKQRGVNGVNNIIKTFMDLAIKNQDIKDRKDEEENHLRVEDNNFKQAMLEAVKGLSEIDTKILEAKESYVQED